MTDPADKMARLDQVIINLVDVFMENTKENGKHKLDKGELRNLLKKEMISEELQDKIKSSDIDKAIEKMDKDDDGKLNFPEFGRFVSILAKGYYFKKTGKGGKGCKDAKEGKGGKGGRKGRGGGKEGGEDCEPDNES